MTPPRRDDVSHVHEAVLTLEPRLESPTEARRFAASRLEAWGVPGLSDTVELAVSELVRNAIEHAGSRCTLTVRLRPGCLRLEVVDDDDHLPSVRRAGPDALSGRGLMLVEALSTAWGAEARAPGKVVWCELDVPNDPSRRP